MRCVRRSARSRNGTLRSSTSRSHCESFFRPFRFSTDRRHVSQYSSKKRSAPSAGSHSRWCMSKCAQRRARSVAPHLVEIGRARQRREDREAGLEQLVALDERPQMLEVRLRTTPDR